MGKEPSPLLAILTLPFLQGYSSGETDFHLHQFLFNFLRYSSSNLPLFHPYSNFAVYLPNNSSLLNSLFSTISILSCLLTSAFIHPSNSFNASFVFSKFSLFSHIFCSTVNPFHCTRYLSTPLIFLLFNIFSISHSLTPSILISFPSFFLCSPTCFLYYTI